MRRWLRGLWRALLGRTAVWDGGAYEQGRFDEHMDVLLGRASCPCCRTVHASVGER